MSSTGDSIVALSTPPGRGGIGVIRVSGPDSLSALRRMTGDNSETEPQPNYMNLRAVVDPLNGETLDQALVCYFKAPHSFTGEDVVEFHCHGSPVLLRRIVDALLRLDVRLASPGEFSLRAVLNGRLQLTQAEAIRDLIDAQTDVAAQQATRQLSGEISHRLQPAKAQLLKMIVRLESSLEFVEDDLPQLEQSEIENRLAELRTDLRSLADTFVRGRLLHDGLKVAIVGRPNAGKSSLFNRLLGYERTIVTEVPGTTRDTISEAIGWDGIPITLIDTAGMRTTNDQVESLGVERTHRAAADADLLVVVVDGSQPLTDEDGSVLRNANGKRHVVAINKSDLPSFSSSEVAEKVSSGDAMSAVSVSALTEAGLTDLRAAMLKPFVNGNGATEGLMITNARHHDLLLRAIDALASSEALIRERASEEIILVGLHNALKFLGQVTGETTTEEILGQIFSTFCIGK
ncbi:MAG TPA: tRNA uridine-5-carboxymethylaminomethyl(34) synthesis GTPase MnmE [Pyrinomonadaceae bacterium]|nr:tRNA uridine-5-carboxymethylaminomethyl(34) synthesis GTPase MnmE [Pyrinomonadaceae bacterium]